MSATCPSVSVIIVSRERPDWLRRCLQAVRQVDYPKFEIVVVADDAGLTQVTDAQIKCVAQTEANISLARNIGVAHAAGDYCAFIDDDAVPEPLWLKHHIAVLAETGAAASVGFVRGRNGISFQSRVAAIDPEAETHSLDWSADMGLVPDVGGLRALKLVGTNCVISRRHLFSLGGFDPAFRFFLEDSDLSLRLRQSGATLAVAESAEVHHGFAASSRRNALRAPRDLFDIGRSSAIFFRKHRVKDTDELYDRLVRREKTRLLGHLVRGTCEPKHIASCMDTLNRGWEDGMTATLQPLEPLRDLSMPLQRIPPVEGHRVSSARLLRRKVTISSARRFAAKGHRASVFSFSLTSVRHHVRYDDGVWVQTGGQFGRSDRDQRFFQWCRFAERLRVEIDRVAKQRGLQDSQAGCGRVWNGRK